MTEIKLKKRILVVDDNEIVLDATGGIVESLGYSFETAGNGQEALVRLEEMFSSEGLPFLVMSDIDMPFVDGFELIKQAREKYPRLQFLMITGNQNHEEKLDRIGVSYLLKPYTIKELQDKISRYN